MTTNIWLAAFALVLFSCGDGSTNQEETTDANTDQNTEVSGTYELDAGESNLAWTGHMLKVGGVSLYNHHGTVDFEKGRVIIENGKIVDGTFVVDMSSITPTDKNFTPEEGRTPEKLVGHLSSDDFFAVENYPTATLEITGMDGDKVMGDLTIRGNTHPVTMEGVVMNFEEDEVLAKGMMTIDRQKFDVAFKMGAQDKVLSDDIDLEYNIKLKKSEGSL